MNWKEISGEFYDGDKRGVMETAPRHNYHKTLTMKILLSRPEVKNPETSIVVCSFKTLRNFIKELDELTKGIPKILYLVGWQYKGHDTGYPAFFEVNPELAEQGEDAGEILKQIMDESFSFNTTVSLHINMTDAYPGNPLWNEYVEEDLISRKRSGKYLITGRWYGRKAYQICYTKEWESGKAVERIERLMKLLPLEKAGTVHIDAFFCRRNAYHGITIEREQEARRKIIRYWRSRDVDVTSEFIYRERGSADLIGLVPMVWHLNQSKKDYLRRPASLLSGGNINKDLRGDKKLNRLFGGSTRGEEHFSNKEMTSFNSEWHSPFLEDFFTNTLPWQFLNGFQRLGTGFMNRKAWFSAAVQTEKKNSTIREKNKILSCNGNLCLPAAWSSAPLMGIFSRNGTDRKAWNLPEGWQGTATVRYESADGHRIENSIPVENGKFTLSLKKGEGGWIQPVSRKEQS